MGTLLQCTFISADKCTTYTSLSHPFYLIMVIQAFKVFEQQPKNTTRTTGCISLQY